MIVKTSHFHYIFHPSSSELKIQMLKQSLIICGHDLLDVIRLLILLAPGLTVGTVPVDKHHQGHDEQDVGDQQGVGNVGHLLIPEIVLVMIEYRLQLFLLII